MTGAADPGLTSPPDNLPDFVIKGRYRFSGGQMSLAALFRQIVHHNGGAGPVGAISSRGFGWGIHYGVGWRFNGGKTAIGGSLFGGRGIGRYSGQGTIQAVLNNGPSDFGVRPVWSVAGQIWVQHRVTNTIRVNAGYGREYVDIVGASNLGKPGLAGGLNQDMWRGWVNMIWQPVPQVNIGVEYMYGFRGAINGPNGKAHRIQIGMQYSF